MAKYFSAEKIGLENEDFCSDLDVTANETYKQSKITYTRDFLLPFAELDICKVLPCGFDPSNLRAFDDACTGVLQRQGTCAFDDACNGIVQQQRAPGEASFLGIRGSEQGSSQYNHDLDFTRHYSNQHQVCWHDGLLGNGTFQRVPAFTTGASAPWDRGIDNCSLKRSDAPYRPPHSYKEPPHSRRENSDSYNVETFGSVECVCKETQDEEKRRQSSFELMRKEQQKTTQGKHNQIADVHEEDPSLLEDSTKVLVNENSESKESVRPPVSNNESAKRIHSIQTAASGPLFSPDFMSGVSARNLGAKSSTNATISKEHVREGYLKNSSSSFAHWFLEEEKKLAGGASCRDEKCGSEVHKVSNGRSTGHNHPNLSSNTIELVAKSIISPKTSATDGISEKSYSIDDPTVTSGVRTSEYLEQSILSDSSRNSFKQHQSVQGWSVYNTENEQPKKYAGDEGASLHFLSYLQKGEGLKDFAYSSELNMGSSDKINPFEFQNSSSSPNSSSNNIEKYKKNPPLKEIFGTCIASRLQSNEASFSIQRPYVGKITKNHDLEPLTIPPSVVANIFIPSQVDKRRSIGIIGERIPSKVDKCRSIGTIGDGILVSNRTRQTELVDIGEHVLGFEDAWANAGFHPQIDQDSKLTPVIGFKNIVDSTDEICLPEEDSLITIDDILAPLHPLNIPARDSIHADFQGSYDVIDSDTSYLNDHSYQERKSYQENDHSQMNPMNPGKQFFCPLDSYQTQMSCQIKSRNTKYYHHNPPVLHHLPQDVLPCPFKNTHNLPTQFDHPVHHSRLEQMQLAGNFPHLLSGLSKGTPLHNDLAFRRQDLNPMQSFPLNYQQPSYAGLGKQDLDFGAGGNNNQIAFNRLLEMKQRAKQIHSLPIGGRGQGNFGNNCKREFGMEKTINM